MKKIGFVMLISLLGLLLAACGSQNEGYYEDETNYYMTNDEAQEPEEDEEDAPLTREDILEDFDYFVEFMQAYFPYLGVVYRRTGVDFMQVAAELRPVLEDEDFELDEYIFSRLMFDSFFGNPGLGGHSFLHFAFDGLWPGYYRDSADINIQTDIIEPGKIAYIRIHSFATRPLEPDLYLTNEFFRETADFEHLIIDIRGNIGGWSAPWLDAIIAPHISETFTMTLYAFSTYTPSAINHLRAAHDVVGSDPRLGTSIESPIMSFDEMPELPYLNKEDAADFAYGFGFSRVINPRIADFPPFEGQIWLLIDERVGSAAAWFTDIVKYSGLATLVGNAIDGNSTLTALPGGWERSRLPNTQLAFEFNLTYNTYDCGRAIEEYVAQPHIFNRDGIDALETVLALIEEGS
jgi:hypothetical protein